MAKWIALALILAGLHFLLSAMRLVNHPTDDNGGTIVLRGFGGAAMILIGGIILVALILLAL